MFGVPAKQLPIVTTLSIVSTRSSTIELLLRIIVAYVYIYIYMYIYIYTLSIIYQRQCKRNHNNVVHVDDISLHIDVTCQMLHRCHIDVTFDPVSLTVGLEVVALL